MKVTELAALVIPAAFLITMDGGTHEITRCYYQGGKYTLGSYRGGRLGEFSVVGADLDGMGNLTIEFSRGYVVKVPYTHLQSTHRV